MGTCLAPGDGFQRVGDAAQDLRRMGLQVLRDVVARRRLASPERNQGQLSMYMPAKKHRLSYAPRRHRCKQDPPLYQLWRQCYAWAPIEETRSRRARMMQGTPPYACRRRYSRRAHVTRYIPTRSIITIYGSPARPSTARFIYVLIRRRELAGENDDSSTALHRPNTIHDLLRSKIFLYCLFARFLL